MWLTGGGAADVCPSPKSHAYVTGWPPGPGVTVALKLNVQPLTCVAVSGPVIVGQVQSATGTTRVAVRISGSHGADRLIAAVTVYWPAAGKLIVSVFPVGVGSGIGTGCIWLS